ncbi:MAG: long-chain fatty acid--CoA ligase [Myxococcales bacterium]|nr:long-chain fatty acid--CoA ligase [Myxococcales bacterium]
MDVTPYLEPRIAPRAVFDSLPERRTRVRFMIQEGDDWRAVTWGAFAKIIRKVALYLSANGVTHGDRAAIFAQNRVEWIASALAIQAAGGAMVPIYGSSTAEQAAYVLGHCDAKVVFVDSAALLGRVLTQLSALPALERIVLLDDSLDAARVHASLLAKGVELPSYSEIEPRIHPFSRVLAIGEARDGEDPQAFERTMNAVSLEQIAVMLYTSGTTGNPKGVPLSHKNVAVNGRDWLVCNAALLREGAVDLLWLPMSHIFGFGEACLGNTLGWVSYLVDPKNVMDLLPAVKPNVFMSVPSVWEKLAQAAISEPDPTQRKARLAAVTGGALEFCLSGGAGLKREVKEAFHGAGTLIIEGYGLTETSPTLTLNRPDAFRFDTVGKPLPSVEVRLAEDGEILARGPSVFGGYHKDPAATAQCFTADGWFQTGDVGRFTDDGFLQIIDRKKDILVTAGGKNVPPANIELRFADDPFVAHVVVYGDGHKYLVAGVWLNEETVAAHLAEVAPDARKSARETLVQQRIDRVNAELASYESIKRFNVFSRPLTVDDGLLTPTLKVRRKKIYEAFREDFEALYR